MPIYLVKADTNRYFARKPKAISHARSRSIDTGSIAEVVEFEPRQDVTFLEMLATILNDDDWFVTKTVVCAWRKGKRIKGWEDVGPALGEHTPETQTVE